MQLRRSAAATLVTFGAVLAAAPSRSQVADVELRTQMYHEPSSYSKMTVYTPEVDVSAAPSDALEVSASWQADAVTGASEAVKAGRLLANVPDIVSRASVRDFRQTATGGVAYKREHTRFRGSYSYGTENDYR